MRKRILGLFPVVMVLALVAGLAPQAGADAGVQVVTVTVSADAVLVDPMLVRLSITVTCDPMEVRSNSGNSELRQAVSKELIASGSGFTERAFVCDGTPQENSFLFWAHVSGPPFSGGSATVNIIVNVCSPSFVCQSGSSGIRVVQVASP